MMLQEFDDAVVHTTVSTIVWHGANGRRVLLLPYDVLIRISQFSPAASSLHFLFLYSELTQCYVFAQRDWLLHLIESWEPLSSKSVSSNRSSSLSESQIINPTTYQSLDASTPSLFVTLTEPITTSWEQLCHIFIQTSTLAKTTSKQAQGQSQIKSFHYSTTRSKPKETQWTLVYF